MDGDGGSNELAVGLKRDFIVKLEVQTGDSPVSHARTNILSTR